MHKSLRAMDIAAEVDISSSAVTSSRSRGGARKRSKSCVDKATKRQKTQSDKENADVQAIQQVAASDLVAAVLGEVDGQLHIATFNSRSAFWEKLKVSDLLLNLCTFLQDAYVTLYSRCGKGKDKHTVTFCEISVRLVFIARTDYESILTTKVSRFTVNMPRSRGTINNILLVATLYQFLCDC